MIQPGGRARSLETEVLVVGAGATGTGVAWDLALRGISCIVVEQGDIAGGTSGRYHGMLHSGARYAAVDPGTARECISENAIVRRIAPRTLEDSRGLFVQVPGDDEAYAPLWREGCRRAGIPVRELSAAELKRREPLLNPAIHTGFEVPDAVCNAIPLCQSLARAAGARGAVVLPWHRLESFRVSNGKVVGARVLDLGRGESRDIEAGLTVNATGPWSAVVAAMLGVKLRLTLSRGAMVAFEGRLVGSTIQRLRPPSDGDAILPRGRVSIGGTTSVPSEDPGDRHVDSRETEEIRRGLVPLVPCLSTARVVHAWAAVRPLYDPQRAGAAGDGRKLSREFFVIDHQERDGVGGMVSVVGGKLATFRLMAEKTVDLVCKKLGKSAPCQTATTAVA